MLQVLTNSSTCFGWSVICVSRSLQWITFTPSFFASWLNSWAFAWWAIFSAAAPLTFLSVRSALGDVEQPLLGEVGDQARIGPVLEHRGRPRLVPAGDHSPHVHVPPVERPLGRVLLLRPGVRVPDLDRRVDVEHAVVVAPLDDLAAVDVPGQVDQQVARRHVLGQQRAHILGRNTILDQRHSLLDPRPERGLVGVEFEDRDLARMDLKVLEQNRNRAARYGAETDKQDTLAEREHPLALHNVDWTSLVPKIIPRFRAEREVLEPCIWFLRTIMRIVLRPV